MFQISGHAGYVRNQHAVFKSVTDAVGSRELYFIRGQKLIKTNFSLFCLSVQTVTESRKEGNILFNDALNTFYLRL